ncbi:tetratricopeptide repeat protein [Roseivirga sp. BDSF3-8]|uniref:tetratricopeptide repeat protein n=1 Tax=Roseivirga sp. BDSF3-8 TaxID=3241598 RepID=UPI0035320A5E
MKRLLPVILLVLTFCACEKEQILEGEQNAPSTLKTIVYLNEKARKVSESNPEEAIEIANKALTLATEKAFLEGQKQSHNTLYLIYLNRIKDIDKAEYHSNAFLSLTKELDKAKDLAYANYKQGALHYENNELADAMPFLFEAYELFLSNGESKKAVYPLYTLSKIFEKVGKHEKGLFYLNKAQLEGIDESFLWMIYHHQGKLHWALNEHKEAKTRFRKSLEVIRNINNPEKELKVLNDLISLSITMGELDEASHLIAEGIEKATSLNQPYYLGKLYWNRGFLFEKKHGVEKSLNQYNRAKEYFEKVKETNLSAKMSLNISRVYFSLHNHSEAETHLKEALDKEELNAPLLKEIFLHQAELANSKGDMALKFNALYEAEKIKNEELENSQYVGVHKAELAYRDKVHTKEHEAYIENIHHEMAESERRYDFYTLCLIGFFVLAILVMVLYKPYRLYMDNSKKVLIRTDDLQRAFQKRLAGYSAIFPTLKEKKVPGPPDERDIHNMWDRLNEKKNKRKGGNPDDENESGKDND